MKLKLILPAVAALAAASASFSADRNNVIDEVAWMVGDQPIYKSDIEEAYLQALYEKAPIGGDPYCVIPERLAIEKLFLHQADLDTVEVQESMVAQQVDQRINYLITNLGTKEKVEQNFRKTLPEIREQMAENMRDQFRIMQVQNSITSGTKTTPSDVRNYFQSLPEDSIPFVPMQIEAQIITFYPKIPQQEIDDIKNRLRDYAERVNSGESSFSTLAIMYSEDGSGVRGGEIGFMGRGHLEPEYAAAAFNLNDTKKVSNIVQTQYGYHIIQLIEKRGDRVNTRHILLQPKASDAEITNSINRMDSLRQEIISGKFTFDDATIASQDKDTRKNHGQMVNPENNSTRFEMAELPQEVALQIDKMEVDSISQPFLMKDARRNTDVVAMVKLSARIPAHKANLSDDYQLIKNMYENSLKSRMLSKWIEKKIKETYVKIEDNWLDCEFEHQGWLKIKK